MNLIFVAHKSPNVENTIFYPVSWTACIFRCSSMSLHRLPACLAFGEESASSCFSACDLSFSSPHFWPLPRSLVAAGIARFDREVPWYNLLYVVLSFHFPSWIRKCFLFFFFNLEKGRSLFPHLAPILLETQLRVYWSLEIVPWFTDHLFSFLNYFFFLCFIL